VKDIKFYAFLRKQVPVMMVLSLFPGLGYIFLGWLNDIELRAIFWYLLIIAASVWGYHLYRHFSLEEMNNQQRERWYRQLQYWNYFIFSLWTLIFLFYSGETENNLHYIAIFTQIGASVVASTLLSPDKKLYRPVLLILMIPLILYFLTIQEFYGYILTIFSMVLTWVLFYAADSSYRLLMKTEHQATHDHLTGLYNRRFFINALQQIMKSLRDTKKSSYLLLIDLDHFKTINDSLGHDVGDQLLQEISARLGKHISDEGIVARLGGDEFIIAGPEFDEIETCRTEAIRLSQDIMNDLKTIYSIDRHHLYISSSIGVSLIDSSSQNANRFIKEADIAMYEVKAKGRDGVFLFDDEMSRRVERHLEIERMLHFAVEKGEISLHYQPILDQDKRTIGAEALVRWNNQSMGMVPPDQFIPIAEQTGLIIELGNHIVETAFRSLRQWHDQGIELRKLAINISMRQFLHQNFVSEIKRLADIYLDEELRGKITFEITETIVAEDINNTVLIIRELKAMGIRFAMDDFGTGYSSLSYLKQLPIDEIKIDRSFVSEVDQHEGDQAMVITILRMAKNFGLKVVAEGVETEDQLRFLQDHKCDCYQGYLFSKPLPEKEYAAFIKQNNESA
jgi:diguanylate cyclase (GGDEF)-like protein